eukprot:3026196-Karenia_brevis.AAC.1
MQNLIRKPRASNLHATQVWKLRSQVGICWGQVGIVEAKLGLQNWRKSKHLIAIKCCPLDAKLVLCWSQVGA